MNYKCLVFDHDDTTVDSTRNVHYPSFVEFMKIARPEIEMSLDDYVRFNFDPGVIGFFRDICGLSEEEMKEEQDFWMEFASSMFLLRLTEYVKSWNSRRQKEDMLQLYPILLRRIL